MCIDLKLFKELKDSYPITKNYYYSVLNNIYYKHHFSTTSNYTDKDIFFRIVPIIFIENELYTIKHEKFKDNIYLYGHITDRDLRENDLEEMIFSSLMANLKKYYNFTMRDLSFVNNLFVKKINNSNKAKALILAYSVKINGAVDLSEEMLNQGYVLTKTSISYNELLHKKSFEEILNIIGI